MRIRFFMLVDLCPKFINFTGRRNAGIYATVRGVTKLRNEIYVLCGSSRPKSRVICVFDDQYPFIRRRIIRLRPTASPEDIASSEMENCLYLCNSESRGIWKITRETDGEYNFVKWLT